MLRSRSPAEVPELAWQVGLLGAAAPPSFDPQFGGARRVALDAASWLEHVPCWLQGADALADVLTAELRWTQREVMMYERPVVEPRLTAWWSLADAAGEPSSMGELLCRARLALSHRYGRTFDSIGFNLYRDGRDSVAWHGDRVRHVTENPVVAIVSLGAPRILRLRRRGGGPSTAWSLGGGDLFVMGGACQHEWEHCVPKTARVVGPRLSVMFRHDLVRPDFDADRKNR